MPEISEYIRNLVEPVMEKYRKEKPDWVVTDSPLKYVDWALTHTLEKSRVLAEYLNPVPGSLVFEPGPGTGYLMYRLKRQYGCRVIGCDVYNRPLYKEVHELLGLDGVRDEPVRRLKPLISLEEAKPVDLIVATQISFMDDWMFSDHLWFINYCMSCLAPRGRIVLFPNPRAFGHTSLNGLVRTYGAYASLLKLPHMNDGIQIVKPLS